jgi:hypothetical protein
MVRDRFSLLSSVVATGSPLVDEMRIVSAIPLSPPPRVRIASTVGSGRTDAEAHESTQSPTTTWPIVLETMPVNAIFYRRQAPGGVHEEGVPLGCRES